MATLEKPRRRRTRTGCFKCRSRRRKCDEKKPKCQRCVDGGFECQYGTKLSFLDKNAITGSVAPSPAAKQSYAVLDFVDVRPSGNRLSSIGSEDLTELKLHVSNTDVSHSSQRSPKEDKNGGLSTTSHPDAVVSPGFMIPEGEAPEFLEKVWHGPAATPQARPHDTAYETALDVLLTLGTTDSTTAENRNPLSTPFVSVSPANYPSSMHMETSPKPSPAQSNNLMPGLTERFSTCALIPQDSSIQLLRHYRYKIAPWLDIGDSAQTFGLTIIRLSLNSRTLLEFVLSLSAASISRSLDLDIRHLVGTETADYVGPLESLSIVALAGVRQFIHTSPQGWQSPFRNMDVSFLNLALARNDLLPVQNGVLWLLLRLDLSVGLLNRSVVSIPDLLSHTVTSPGLPGALGPSVQFAYTPLLLCAQILNYSNGQDVLFPSAPFIKAGTVHGWRLFYDSLLSWYNTRSEEFLPMLELEEDRELFPLILFNSGAAILSNQLFHTAMLLLLQNRPRTLLKDHGGSMMTSPLWHAQRVCGICLHNDRQESWDFSLIGSLYAAAKRMTYEPQQRALLLGIDRIAEITGWDLGSIASQLSHDWQSD